MLIDAGHFDFRALKAHAASNRVQDGIRLLVNFFEHEMLEAAFFNGFDLHL